MEYILLWLLLGLIGYSLLAYQDIMRVMSRSKGLRLEYTKREYLIGMLFALVLGPLTIIWFIVKGKN